MNTNLSCFYYGKLGRHIGMIYALLILLVFIPIPFYSEFLFNHHINENAALILEMIGLIALIIYIWSDWENQKLYRRIVVYDHSIESSYGSDVTNIKWDNITKLEKLKYGDTDSLNALGMFGVRLIGDSGKKIVIYEHIKEYDKLLKIVESRVTRDSGV